jgi:simple sugar transport system ATP-binding protein
MSVQPILEMKHITKIYGTLKANDDINLKLFKGQILAVIGENGAGKSTLMKILYGLEQATDGEIYLNGEKKKIASSHDAMQQHIGMVQQHFMLLDSRTVAENIVYGGEPRKNKIFFDRKEASRKTSELCEQYGLEVDPVKTVGKLPIGLQQRVEILKVLYQNADIIIFDEPTAVLTPQEIDDLLETMKKLAKMGKSLIIITHKLNEVEAVADHVLVMRAGKYIKEMDIGETSIEEMSYLMVGRHLKNSVIEEKAAGAHILDVNNAILHGAGNKNILDSLTMHVSQNEIVGIAGVSGNGQSELIRCITGLQHIDEGAIQLNGKDISHGNVASIRNEGITCIPEDRYYWGCAAQADMIENTLMAHQYEEKLSKKGLLNNQATKEFAQRLIKDYNVKSESLSQKASELSGGNIQKLIVAREIEHHSPLLIAAEPTRGVDIGAMEYIHNQLIAKRNNGEGVLLISSELSEILKLSDRIYVIFEGKIVGEFTRHNVTEQKLGILMMGGRLHEEN